MVAELSGDTGRRGEHGRRGYGERRRRAPLGREPGKGRGHGRGREGSGGAWRSGEASRASGKESGKQEVARRVPACGGHTPRVLLARGGRLWRFGGLGRWRSWAR